MRMNWNERGVADDIYIDLRGTPAYLTIHHLTEGQTQYVIQ